ncbi:polysaccharide export protein [Bacteroidia bacterium]|nr:polysaccharide export protein [Bacteroidia bacterium]MDB9882889.1 polysaccharide export protein [Bacteroidia bacterium]
MKNLLLLVTPLILLLMLASCGGTHNLLDQKKSIKKANSLILDSAFLYNPNFQYVIKEDDKLTISIWGQADLSVGSTYGIYNSNEVYGKYLMVDANGNIEVPKVGTLIMEGMTMIELKDSIKSLFAKWIVNPILDVKILNKDIIVMGEVNTPGVYDIDKNYNSLFNMIALSGGLEDYANLKYVKVFRQEGPHTRVATLNLKKNGEYLAQNLQLVSGDIVVVPSKRYKEFDRRISVIIPFTSALTSAAIFKSAFN